MLKPVPNVHIEFTNIYVQLSATQSCCVTIFHSASAESWKKIAWMAKQEMLLQIPWGLNAASSILKLISSNNLSSHDDFQYYRLLKADG